MLAKREMRSNELADRIGRANSRFVKILKLFEFPKV